MKKQKNKENFDLEAYLKKWEHLMPDYNPEYIPKDEREKGICNNYPRGLQ